MLKSRKLLVGSVFVSGERTKHWYNLQIDFLRKNTKSFEHFVFLNGEDIDKSIFIHSEIVGTQNHHAVKVMDGNKQSSNHLFGMRKILETFRKIEAENYLFLDCDCFPVKKDWMHWLIDMMNIKNKSIAAPIRTENLDTFPHPSALFLRSKALNCEWFDLSIGETTNLMGEKIHDVGCKLPLSKCYPLLRTNYFNPHPIFGAIYGHAFYHHTCGTRPKGMVTRGIGNGILNHFTTKHWEIEEIIFNSLITDPELLMSKLMGDYNMDNKI